MTKLPTIDSNHILRRRGPKEVVDPWAIPTVVTDQEPDGSGNVRSASSVFLIGKECPFRCLMCDLWQQTLDVPTPTGALVRQLDLALSQITHRQVIKLYNASNFFDAAAVPSADWEELLKRLNEFETVVVENHPRLVGRQVREFSQRLTGRLQVAMGLETSDPEILQWLNKGMSLADYDRACIQLRDWDISIRSFVLLPAPGVARAQAVQHTLASVQHALALGSQVCSLIPLRAGNGILDELVMQGLVQLPDLELVEQVFQQALECRLDQEQVVLLDLWDLERLAADGQDPGPYRQRLEHWNQLQSPR